MGIGVDRLVMLMTGQASIQEVLLFPQMRPEKKAKRDAAEDYIAIGIPAEWVETLQKLEFATVESIKTASHGKLFNDLCGYNKKNKLGLKNPTADEVKGWIELLIVNC
jgi:lysyl-tRNA synthetase class 2